LESGAICAWKDLRLEEGEGGVAVLEGAGLAEAAEGWGEGELAGVLGNDEGGGSEEDLRAGAAEQGERVGVVGGGIVRGVEEEDVEGGEGGDGSGRAVELSLDIPGCHSVCMPVDEAVEGGDGAARFEGVSGADAERVEVGAEVGEGGLGAFGEEDVSGSAAEGLDADGSGAGVEVGEAGLFDAGLEDVEQGLAEAVAGGAGAFAARGDEGARAKGSSDDAHGLMVPGGGWVRRGCASQVAAGLGSATGWVVRPVEPAELASIYVQLAAQDASDTTGNIYGAGGGKGQP